jgi:hypothetical protein
MAVKTQSRAAELRALADRFRRLSARSDDARMELDSACAWGAKLLVQLSEANLLPFPLPKPSGAKALSDDTALDWLCLWRAAGLVLSHQIHDRFPSNPDLISWERVEDSPEDVRIGRIKRSQCRARAENYAAICSVLADDLDGRELSPTADRATALEMFAGPDLAKIMKIIDSQMSAEDKAIAICGIDKRFLSNKYDSPWWGKALGVGVDGAAIRKTKFWKVDRKRASELIED